MKNDIHTPSFSAFEFRKGLLADLSEDEFPTKLYAWVDSDEDEGEKFGLDFGPIGFESTFFGFVHEGEAVLSIDGHSPYFLKKGMYFSTNKPFSISGGKGILVESVGYNGVFNIGGPIEPEGRLKYIDGCTDSLLIPPVKKGDACFNHLHFPSSIDQTPHTHPSMRVGIVAKGKGVCVTPWGNVDLVPGNIFIIKPNPDDGLSEATDKHYETGEDVTDVAGTHSFFTQEEEMDVIAYHPDSDVGSEDENHPMVNRTIVGGESAADMPEIRTK